MTTSKSNDVIASPAAKILAPALSAIGAYLQRCFETPPPVGERADWEAAFAATQERVALLRPDKATCEAFMAGDESARHVMAGFVTATDDAIAVFLGADLICDRPLGRREVNTYADVVFAARAEVATMLANTQAAREARLEASIERFRTAAARRLGTHEIGLEMGR